MASKNSASENKTGETSEVGKIETKPEAVTIKTGAAQEVLPPRHVKRVLASEDADCGLEDTPQNSKPA